MTIQGRLLKTSVAKHTSWSVVIELNVFDLNSPTCFRGLTRFRKLSAVSHTATNHWGDEVNYIQVMLYCLAKMYKPPHYCEHKLPTVHPMLLGFCGTRCNLFPHLFPMTLLRVSCSKLKKLSEDSLTKQPEEVFDVLEKLGEGWVSCFFHEQHFSFQMCGMCLLLRHFYFTWSNLCRLPSLIITFVFSSKCIMCLCVCVVPMAVCLRPSIRSRVRWWPSSRFPWSPICRKSSRRFPSCSSVTGKVNTQPYISLYNSCETSKLFTLCVSLWRLLNYRHCNFVDV